MSKFVKQGAAILIMLDTILQPNFSFKKSQRESVSSNKLSILSSHVEWADLRNGYKSCVFD
jgi:hypothetical protein